MRVYNSKQLADVRLFACTPAADLLAAESHLPPNGGSEKRGESGKRGSLPSDSNVTFEPSHDGDPPHWP